MRDTRAKETLRVDAAQGAPQPEAAHAVFQTASSDGSRVFFTDANKLTADSTASENEILKDRDLYELDLTTKTLTDLTVDHNSGESADVLGVILGASEDGSYVYFVANGVLASGAQRGNCPEGSEAAVSGAACSLYVAHFNGAAWEAPVFIARLASEGFPDWQPLTKGIRHPDHPRFAQRPLPRVHVEPADLRI